MAREQPAGRTLRSLGLPEDVEEDITWHNAFRFLGIDAPRQAEAQADTRSAIGATR
jgi:aminocarboxymuconate-semialdehyde decarboxylase